MQKTIISAIETIIFICLFLLYEPLSITALPRSEEDVVGHTGSIEVYSSFFATLPFPNSELPEEFQNQNSPVLGQFSTEFSRALFSFDDVLSGGPPKDGIPAINEPLFVDNVDWLGTDESVLLYEGDEVLKVYPIQILMYHEIVNDVVDGLPLALTYCPLCNTGIAFAALDFRGRPLTFGVSGLLRFSNMIMYDHQSESWWQQATGQSITGEYAGSQLTIMPLRLLSWSQAQELAKESGKGLHILSRETGHVRRYGSTPYPGYDTSEQPFLYRGPMIDESFHPMERVLSVQHKGEWVYQTFSDLRKDPLHTTYLAGDPILFLYSEGVTSPFEASTTGAGRDVGSVQVYLAIDKGGEKLNFHLRDDGFIEDENTGSIWSQQGIAIRGPLTGSRLSNLPSVNHFWFSWSSFAAELR